MKITDLKIGQFATRKWHNNNKSLCVKRSSNNTFEYWKNRQFSSTVRDDSSIYKRTDLKLCDCNGTIIEEFTYPLFMESTNNGIVVKFNSLTSGILIIQGESSDQIGYKYNSWIEHTNTKHWKPCDFSKAPEMDELDYWDARFKAGLPVCYSNKEGINNVLLSEKPSDYVKYQAKGTYKFYIQDESKTEFTYPMCFECIANHCDKGMIVKFTELDKGLLVKEAKNGICKITIVSIEWTKHTDQKSWKQVDFDETIGKIIPNTDDIDELISDLKSIIEDDDNRFSPSEYGAGTQLRESGYDQCHDLIDEWLEKYHITKAPNIGKEDFRYFGDLYDVIVYFKELLSEKQHKQNVDNLFGQNPFDEYVQNTEPSPCYLGVDYASQQDIEFVPQDGAKSRLQNDALDALSYTLANSNWKLEYLQPTTGATEVANNLNKTKEFTMNNELKDAILELIATNGKPKVKKPKTPKIVCNVEGTLMEFADEDALKSFMWSSRVESVIRYDLAGKVTVPFELSVEATKTKASE